MEGAEGCLIFPLTCEPHHGVGIDRFPGLEGRIEPVYLSEKMLCHLHRGDLSGADPPCDVGGAEFNVHLRVPV